MAEETKNETGCGTWIRTKITAARELRPTIRRSRNDLNYFKLKKHH